MGGLFLMAFIHTKTTETHENTRKRYEKVMHIDENTLVIHDCQLAKDIS